MDATTRQGGGGMKDRELCGDHIFSAWSKSDVAGEWIRFCKNCGVIDTYNCWHKPKTKEK